MRALAASLLLCACAALASDSGTSPSSLRTERRLAGELFRAGTRSSACPISHVPLHPGTVCEAPNAATVHVVITVKHRLQLRDLRYLGALGLTNAHVFVYLRCALICGCAHVMLQKRSGFTQSSGTGSIQVARRRAR